jgi:hypothetical protein
VGPWKCVVGPRGVPGFLKSGRCFAVVGVEIRIMVRMVVQRWGIGDFEWVCGCSGMTPS